MSKGPEANSWLQLKKNLPKKSSATRIENKHGGGIPDVHILWEGLPFWVELKTTKSNAIKISPQQVAWHYSYYVKKGLSFFLIKSLSSRDLFLFGGYQGARLKEQGLCELAPFWLIRSCDFASLFASLRPLVACHYRNILDPEPGSEDKKNQEPRLLASRKETLSC